MSKSTVAIRALIESLINNDPAKAEEAATAAISAHSTALVQGEEAITEARMKMKMKEPTFKKYTNFEQWNDENGGEYSETEIDGKQVGVLTKNEKIIGLWYRSKKVGSISLDFAKIFPKYSDDVTMYSEVDPTWPWSDKKVVKESEEYENSSEFTNEMLDLVDVATDLKNKLSSEKMAKWMKVTDDNYDTDTRDKHEEALELASSLHAKLVELLDEMDSAA